MSTTSIARQNRRLRQMQLSNINTSKAYILKSSYAINSSENSSSLNGNSLPVDKEDNERKLEEAEDNDESVGCSYIKCDISSRPIGKIFVEDENGFKAIDASVFFQSIANGTLETNSRTDLAIDLAHKSARYFHNFTFFCHGLLGGMSFIQTLLMVHLITNSSPQDETLKHYQFLSQPIHNIFNFLCIVCCVSAFDRYDIGNLRQLFDYIKKCKFRVIIVVIYPLCLLLGLSTANVDEKLCLSDRNISQWESFKHQDNANEIFYWETLSIAKCAGAFLAWIIIALEPNKNFFLRHLKKIIQKNNINGQ